MSQLEQQLVDYFTQHPEAYQPEQQQLQAFLRQLQFHPTGQSEQIFPVSLFPLFIQQDQADRWYGSVQQVLAALLRIRQEYRRNQQLRDYLALPATEQLLFELDDDVKGVGCVRADGFIANDGSLKIVEFNTDYPDALTVIGRINDYFRQRPHIKPLPLHNEPNFGQQLLHSLVAQYRLNGGTREQPVIGIFAPQDRWWHGEFTSLQQFFESAGVSSHLIDPLQLEVTATGLQHKGQPIDIVRRCTETPYFMQHQDALAPFLQAYQQKNFTLYNSFQDRLLGYKSLFAALSDPQWQHLFTAAQQVAIAAHIPWTRRVSQYGTIQEGAETVPVRDFLLKNQQRMVIKPVNLAEGKGVVIGNDEEVTAWKNVVEQLLADVAAGQSWIIQEKVAIGTRPIYDCAEGAVTSTNAYFDLVFYLFGTEEPERYLTAPLASRYSQRQILNVAQGGGFVPVFQY